MDNRTDVNIGGIPCEFTIGELQELNTLVKSKGWSQYLRYLDFAREYNIREMFVPADSGNVEARIMLRDQCAGKQYFLATQFVFREDVALAMSEFGKEE